MHIYRLVSDAGRPFVAAMATMAMLAFPVAAPAADLWGCEVLLCLSNPAGPTAVPECDPPIQRLRRHLRRGGAFPACPQASSDKGSAAARPGTNYYERCPTDATELAPGERALLANSAKRSAGEPEYVGPIRLGIGSGEGVNPYGDAGTVLKTCVGQPVGQLVIMEGEGTATVTLYDRMWTIAPAGSPAYVDIYVNDHFERRVRY